MLTPPNTLHIRHQMRYTGLPRPWEVTYGVLGLDIMELDDAEQLAAGLHNAFAAAWMPGMSSAVTLERTLYAGALTDDTLVSGEYAATTVGSDNDSVPPPNTALLIRKRTGLAGRRNRGRIYIPSYIDESNIDNRGTIDSTSTTAANTTAASWLAAIEALNTPNVADTQMVILHAEAPATPVVSVSSLAASNIVATQRRRLQRQ